VCVCLLQVEARSSPLCWSRERLLHAMGSAVCMRPMQFRLVFTDGEVVCRSWRR
jgi:hypothetical protein